MTDLITLEKKINELEKRLLEIEKGLGHSSSNEEVVLMDALYRKAKELVIKHNKASVIFLQKKLIIDYARASKLLEKLREDGVMKNIQTG